MVRHIGQSQDLLADLPASIIRETAHVWLFGVDHDFSAKVLR